jgi:hypothetical protein
MIEIIGVSAQTIIANGAALFPTTALKSGCGAERHRDGSSQITLAKPGIYEISFSGDIAVPSTGTAGAISMALAVDGEPIPGTKMTSTPGTLSSFNSISTDCLVRVCAPCCAVITAMNTSAQAITLQNANLVVTRVSGA